MAFFFPFPGLAKSRERERGRGGRGVLLQEPKASNQFPASNLSPFCPSLFLFRRYAEWLRLR